MSVNLKVKMPKLTISSIGMALAVIFIMLLSLPYFSYSGQGIKISWIVYLLWLLTVFTGNSLALKKTVFELRLRRFEITFLFLWLMVVMFNATLERGNTWDLHLIIMITMCMVISMTLYYAAQRNGSYETFVKIILLVFGIEVIRSLPHLWSTPSLARIITGGEANPQEMMSAGKAGVGAYGYYTGLAIVLPSVITITITSRGITRILLCFFIAAITLAISISTFMGAIFLMLLGFCCLAFFHIIYGKLKQKIFILYGVVFVLFFVAWITKLDDIEQVMYVANKIERQFSSVTADGIIGGDETGRSDLWLASMNTFLNYPLVGIGATTNRENPDLGVRVGGHSSWLDQLAEYGIVGFGCYLFFFSLAIKRIVIAFRNEKSLNNAKICYLGQLISIALFVVGGIYNPVVIIIEVFVLFYILGIK